MKIIIVGQGPFGEKVLEALIRKGEKIIGIFSPPDKRGEAMSIVAEKKGIFSLRPYSMKDPRVQETFIKLKPDLGLLAFVTDILPEKLLEIPLIGTICYHPSLLPKHRGASAIYWAIIQGDTRTGLTIFWADKGIDTGPILLQKEIEVHPEDTAGSLYFNTLFPLGVEAMVEAVDLIKKGEATKIPQDESKATYEPPCDDRVALIDFKKTIQETFNLIRGCDPQPGAYTIFKEKKIRFYGAQMQISKESTLPGTILSVDKERLHIAAKGGILKIEKLRVDQGEKIGAAELVQSLKMKMGDRFVG